MISEHKSNKFSIMYTAHTVHLTDISVLLKYNEWPRLGKWSTWKILRHFLKHRRIKYISGVKYILINYNFLKLDPHNFYHLVRKKITVLKLQNFLSHFPERDYQERHSVYQKRVTAYCLHYSNNKMSLTKLSVNGWNVQL